MAKFSQQFLANLGRPQMAESLFGLGTAIGEAPAAAKAAGKRKQLADIMQRGNAALVAGDATNIGRVRRELEAAGFAQEAAKLAQAEAQARQQQATSGMLMSAVADPTKPLSPEVIQERLGEGLTAEGLSSALQVKKALTPPPFLTQEQEFDLLNKGYSNENIQKYKQTKNLVDLGKPTVKKPKTGFTITEWVDDFGNVVEKTTQDEEGKTLRVGDRTVLSSQDLASLKIRSKPSSVVNVTSAQESQLAKDLGGGLAKEVIKASTDAREAENNLSLIAEARIVANERPEIFGAGANEINSARRGTQRVMQLLGVPETDATYRKIANATSAADVVNAFTQDFVRARLEATKGAISNREFETFIASVPNLLSTPEGYQQLLNFMEASNTRTVLRGAALSKAGADSKKIQAVKDKWSTFTRDFPATSFIPPDDVEKLWRMYEEGKVNKKNLSFSTNIIDSEGNPTGQRRTLTYKQLEDMAKSQEDPIAAMLLLRRLYLKEGADTRFVMPN